VSRATGSRVALRPWLDGDLGLLQRLLGDPAMMAHLGGPESPQAIEARHQRYLHPDDSIGGLFAVVVEDETRPAESSPEPPAAERRVGWVGFWETDWDGGGAWEAGWSVLPEFQGRGVATAATALLLDRARDDGTYQFVYAFPRVGNVASNALCHTLGFELIGEADVEYPKGHVSRSLAWRYDLQAQTRSGAR